MPAYVDRDGWQPFTLSRSTPPTSASLPRMAAESVGSVMSCSACDQWLHMRGRRSNGK